MKVWRMGDGEVRVERCWTDSERKIEGFRRF